MERIGAGGASALIAACALAFCGSLVAGCTSVENSLGPRDAADVSRSQLRASIVEHSDGRLVVRDAVTGDEYEYSPNARALRIRSYNSSTIAIELDDSLAAQALEVVLGVAETNSFIRSAEYIDGLRDELPQCGNGDLSGCQMGAPVNTSTSSQNTNAGPVLYRRAISSPGPLVALALFGSDPCETIGTAIGHRRYLLMHQALQQKLIVDTFKASVSAAVEADGELKIGLGDARAAIMNLMVDVAVNKADKIANNFLTMQWNQAGCRNAPIQAGPHFVPKSFSGLAGSGTTLALECVDEIWEISFDGGVTWEPKVVQNCDVRKKMN
jgi:hypothetical protein